MLILQQECRQEGHCHNDGQDDYLSIGKTTGCLGDFQNIWSWVMCIDFVGNSFAEIHEILRRANYTKDLGEFIPFFSGVFSGNGL